MKDDSTNVLNDEVQESMSLPENAFTELKPGEEYVPPMRPDKTYPEATGYSVSMGLIMAVIFSAAAAVSPVSSVILESTGTSPYFRFS